MILTNDKTDLFRGLKQKIDFNPCVREEYEKRVVSKDKLLDIGGRNSSSKSRRRINLLSENPNSIIVSTDIVADYKPDLVDDICNSKIEHNSFSGIYCDAILEHVKEYWLAIDNIHNILKPGGEAFIYVPFFWSFHDKMDYHRFTYTEVARMLENFSELKIFSPGGKTGCQGFGSVFWYVLTMSTITQVPPLFKLLSRVTNFLLNICLSIVYYINQQKIKYKFGDVSRKEFCFYCIHLYMNHGFCAWVRK